MATYDAKKLRTVYDGLCGKATATCRFVTESVGGMSSDKKGIEAFVRYQLGITDPDEAEKAVQRILTQELGETDVPYLGTGDKPADEQAQTAAEAELVERIKFGVNQVRRDNNGPWLGAWMIAACLKNAASGLGFWMDKKGTKRDMSEFGLVEAIGRSKIGGGVFSNRIYVRAEDGSMPETYFQEFKGSVNTPAGRKSIVTNSECLPAGAIFEFSFQFHNGKLTEKDLVEIFACAQVIGVGSNRSLYRGKFEIEKLTITDVATKQTKTAKLAKLNLDEIPVGDTVIEEAAVAVE